ncbi:exported hypothetical protein [Paraburkholderia piptadeniae]|uniref:Uncharacterized protein n=1 Tax=Paraburkholderia piptadeniae TaxID=1701573 RepID=A0A1N7SEK9_9BURK|nr:exported hypothetical protein [Paraburkholderia piptadeniae]
MQKISTPLQMTAGSAHARTADADSTDGCNAIGLREQKLQMKQRRRIYYTETQIPLRGSAGRRANPFSGPDF